MNLLDCYAAGIDAGTETKPYRTSSHAIVAVMEGSGKSIIGDVEIAGNRGTFLPYRIERGYATAPTARRDFSFARTRMP